MAGTSWSEPGRPAGGSGRRRAGHRRRVRALHRFLPGPAAVPDLRRGGPAGRGRRAPPARAGRGPKYKNTAGTAVYDKSRVLYGLNWAKKAVVDTGRVVVCEGYTDVIGLQRAGVSEAVATCGTALADGHIRLLTNFARRIVLAYDADAAGQAAAERYYDWERRFDVDIRVAALPAGADPADLARRDPEALVRAVDDARPYLAFRLDRLFGHEPICPPRRDGLGPRPRPMAVVDEHPNELVRDQYLMQVADRCRVEPDRLRQHGWPSRRARPSRAPGPAASRPVPARRPWSRRAWRRAVAVSGPEFEALRLAVHRPERSPTGWRVLFAHPLARAASRRCRCPPRCTTPSRRPIRRPRICSSAWPSRTPTPTPTTS